MFNRKTNIARLPLTQRHQPAPEPTQEHYDDTAASAQLPVAYDETLPPLIDNPDELRAASILQLKNQVAHERNMARWRRDNKERFLEQARNEARLEKQHDHNADALDAAIHALTGGNDEQEDFA